MATVQTCSPMVANQGCCCDEVIDELFGYRFTIGEAPEYFVCIIAGETCEGHTVQLYCYSTQTAASCVVCSVRSTFGVFLVSRIRLVSSVLYCISTVHSFSYL